MSTRPITTLLIALALTLPTAYAQDQSDDQTPPPWSQQDIETAQAQCRANMTATGIEGPKVQRYCECATQALQERFSAVEVKKMRREHNPSDSEDNRPPELAQALEQCSPVLESQ